MSLRIRTETGQLAARLAGFQFLNMVEYFLSRGCRGPTLVWWLVDSGVLRFYDSPIRISLTVGLSQYRCPIFGELPLNMPGIHVIL